MICNKKFSKLIKHRLEKFDELKRRRLTMQVFSNKNYQYLRQNRLKPIAKAHDTKSLVYNYVYWMIHIERKICIERQLMEASEKGILTKEATSKEILLNNIKFYKKRRNQSIQRLIRENNIKVESAILIFDDVLELRLEGQPFLFYCNKSAFDKVSKTTNIEYGVSKDREYIALLNMHYSLNKEYF